MKRTEQLSNFQKMNLADLQKEIFALEKSIQEKKMAIAFGKAKDVRTMRNFKRQVARALTVANAKLATEGEK